MTSLLVATQSAQAVPNHSSTKAATAAATKALTAKRGPGGRVIVMLKNKTTSYTAKTKTQKSQASAAKNTKQNLVGKIKGAGGSVSHSYSLINAVSAKVSQTEANRLANDSSVAQVIPDEPIRETPPVLQPKAGSGVQPPTSAPTGTCPTNGGTQLEPEALEATHADSDVAGAKTARSLGYDGSGVTVAWIADGLDINNPDFQRNGHSIFTDYQDFSGDGAAANTGGDEAFLDASAIGAQGNQTYDISKFSARPLDSTCKIRIEGEAPGVDLVGLNIFGDEDAGFNSSFIQAIQYAATVDHVDVLNESLGSNPYPDDQGSLDAVEAANDAAVAQGVTITASSGDAGVTNTIGSPAGDPNVISVGASTTYRFYLQTGYGGARLPGVTGWTNNNISSLSSGGFTQHARTVDLVAPGDLNWALCTANPTKYSECADFLGNPSSIEESGGTSESAPVTAGVAALVIQAYKEAHNGNSPTPAVVKTILTSTADDVAAPAEQQGAGLLDAYKAVQLAKSWALAAHTGHTLRSSVTQFSATGKINAPERFTDTVHNTGSTTQTVHATSRALGGYSRLRTTSVTLNDTSSQKYVDFQGVTDNVGKVTFTVPSGEDRLNASIAFTNTGDPNDLNGRVRMDLVDPNGKLASYSLPQGNGNYGNGQVAEPTAGTWTAYITSRDGADDGFLGKVNFAATAAKFAPLGGVSPSSLTLAPGASGKFTLKTDTKNVPGDRSGALLLTTSDNDAGISDTTTVPVSMRTLIPSGRHTFSDILTGGNGRAFFTGQTAYYNLDVPSGAPALNAYIKVADDPGDSFYAELVNPSGDVQALGANATLTSFGGTPASEPQLGADIHVLKPAAGRWAVIITFAPVVSGNSIKEPFSVTTDQTATKATSTGIPNSTKKVLKRGQSTTAYVRIKNSGTSPEAFFIDPRKKAVGDYELAPLTDPSTTEPIKATSNIPEYFVPSRTTAIAAAAQTDGPADIQADMGYINGDPDIASGTGKQVTMGYQAGRVASGIWSVVPTEVGPYTAPGATETVDTAMVAETQAFDTSMKPSTGDLWLQSVDQTENFNTITVDPGQVATIPVQINAPTRAGKVSGVLYVDDAQLLDVFGAPVPNGNEITAIPYSYTVK